MDGGEIILGYFAQLVVSMNGSERTGAFGSRRTGNLAHGAAEERNRRVKQLRWVAERAMAPNAHTTPHYPKCPGCMGYGCDFCGNEGRIVALIRPCADALRCKTCEAYCAYLKRGGNTNHLAEACVLRPDLDALMPNGGPMGLICEKMRNAPPRWKVGDVLMRKGRNEPERWMVTQVLPWTYLVKSGTKVAGRYSFRPFLDQDSLSRSHVQLDTAFSQDKVDGAS